MRLLKTRAFVAAVVLVLAIACGCAGLPGDLPWPTYHHNSSRSGQNLKSQEITNPGTLGAVWIFPRISQGVNESDTIVDDKSPLCRVTRGWFDMLAATDSYDGHFWHGKAVGVKPDETLTGKPAEAEWQMPGSLPRGTYQIYVWVPSFYTDVTPRPRNAPRVKYKVYDDRGVTTVIFDQSEGGAWKLLSPRFFQFAGTSAYKVVVTTETDLTEREIADHNYIVVADAVKFVPATGQEIFSSPTSAILPYRFDDGTHSWQGDAPFVYVGTVDRPLTNQPEASDLGSVYCINSVTPFAGDNFSGNPELNTKLAEKLGTVRWKYPDTDPALREELEGPIKGGVFSSPTIVKVGASDRLICYVAGMDRQVYALDAENGDLLWKGPGITATERDKDDPNWDSWTTETAMDAFGGKYRWIRCIAPAGTGLRVGTWDFTGMLSSTGAPSEEQNGLSYAVYAWLPTADPDEPARCRDAVYTITYEDGAATANITVDQNLPESQGKWVKLGSSYFNVQSVTLKNTTNQPDPGNFCIAVDALMIVPDTVDAFGYSTPVANTNGDTIFAATSGGRIVSFFAEPFTAHDPAAAYAGIGRMRWIYPQVRTKLAASADQDPLGEFGASPAFAGDRLFVASFDGKVRALTGLGNDFTTSADEDWVFPNSKNKDDAEENVIGFTSSPTLYPAGKQLFIGSTGGAFYCLNMDNQGEDSDDIPNSQLIWRYPADPSGPVDPTKPDQGSPMPLGAFRYSTPTVAKMGLATYPRVWCGSSDGKVYSFDTSPGATERRIWVEFNEDGSLKKQHGPAGVWYYEPQVGSPIQGSIAFDGGANGGAPTMFVGDMRGTLHWFVSATGDNTQWRYKGWRTEGELFSSPNVTDTAAGTAAGSGRASWIYVGASDGRLYAFSDQEGAWGGDWHGGVWPFEGDPNEGRTEQAAGPATEIQFDIFPADFSRATERLDPELKSGANYLEPVWPDDPAIADDPSGSGDPSALGKTMKIVPKATADAFPTDATRDDAIDAYLLNEAKKRRNHAFEGRNRASNSMPLYFEWGETIYIVLWNLPEKALLSGSSDSDKRNSIRFNFSNSSEGENAGSQIRLTGNIKFLKEYTVLNGSTADTNNPPTQYDALTYDPSGTHKGADVKRCYALGQIEIRSTSSRPPSPGPGWILTANIMAMAKETATSLILPLAKLKPGAGGTSGISYEPVLVDSNDDGAVDTYKEQLVGINNPLAIRDDGDLVGIGKTDLAWPDLTTGANAFTTYNARNDPEAHYNGNAVAGGTVGDERLATGIIPTLNLKLFGQGAPATGRGVPHGTSSREGWLGIMDRSATGCSITNNATTPPTTATISRFRINARDLRWRGDVGAISNSGGIRFPWDQGPGSVDYPHIFQRSQSFRKASDDADPSNNSASLPALILRQKGAGWDTDYGINPVTCPVMRPDTVFVSVDVPRFQPANGRDGDKPTNGSRYDMSGYSRLAQAYVDSDGNREFGSGNTIRGRPNTYQEAYREFKTWLTVPPDPRIEVEEQTIDVGRAPHGLGEALEGTPLWFQPYNPNPLIRQWFKKLTVKNAGNVNLYNLRIARWIVDQAGTAYDLGLVSDQVNPTAPLPATTIVSSLDGNVPVFSADPFATRTVSGFGDLGYTLSKARVGDPDPTILTIPDRRKWDTNYDRSRDGAQRALGGVGWPSDQPLAPYVSVQVPLTQPMGTYMSFNPLFRDYTIPVFGDVSGDGKLQSGEPFAAPSFHLKITVRESQLTGGVTPTTLPQVDSPTDASPMPRVGDATPAAFKDADTGNVYLFWSSNRMFDPNNYPDWTGKSANADAELADFASAPWFIDRAMLEWDSSAAKKGWLPVRPTPNAVAERWWKPPSTNPYLPDAQWPDLTNVMPWTIGGSDTGLYQVRHHSPVIAENLWTGASGNKDYTWLAWAGSADRLDPATNKIQRDYMLFYTDATHGDVTSADRPVYTIMQTPGAPGHDPSMEKRYPSLSVFDSDMWMFWQGGQKGAWSILFSTQQDLAGKHDPVVSPWTRDTMLRTPDCLATVGSPNAVYRQYWVDYTGDTPVSSNSRNMFDIIYSGTSKLRQNSDILLGKYIAVTQQEQTARQYSPDVLPGRAAVRLPRQFGEKLARDPRFGFFTSQHLAWVRLESSKLARREQTPVIDNWGGYAPAGPNIDPDLPYIHVVLPAGYEDDSGKVWTNGAVISATDGSISSPDGDVTPEAILPAIDEATGVYTYKYPQAATAAILGDMLVDFSEGIVRFTKPLVERANTDGSISAPEIFADYTPRTWRLTTDMSADSSPRAFIERTDMNQSIRGPGGSLTPVTPGLCKWKNSQNKDKQAPVDRLWVFWRKAGSGIESSTIFYRTFRIGVDLAELPYVNPDPGSTPELALPVRMNPDGTPTNTVTVTGNLGPYDVDRTGRIIWFTETEERYRSMFTPELSLPPTINPYFGPGPGPITIKYTATDGDEHEVKAEDIFWRTELPEQSLFGFAADSNVNEGSIYAFADPKPTYKSSQAGTFAPLPTSKIWVFWTSTRGGTSDLFWETLSPNFSAR